MDKHYMDKHYSYEIYLKGSLIYKLNSHFKLDGIISVNNKNYKILNQSEPFVLNPLVSIVLCNVEEIIEYRYRWECSSDDGSFNDSSKIYFDTQEECYLAMRNSALEKMKWNTEWCDVVDCADEDSIGYKVSFFKDKIIHSSYSGVYTYVIIKEKK